MEKLPFSTTKEKDYSDVSGIIENAIQEKGWKNGLLTVFVPHTSAGVTINEKADPDVPHDMMQHFIKLVPRHAHYLHAEGNSDSHILSSMMGSSVQIIVSDGKLQLGTWQAVFFCEFDGPRERQIWIEFLEKK